MTEDDESPESVTFLDKASEEQLDQISLKWNVRAPLHQVAFYPDTDAPQYFAYGGEQVPLSVWSLPKTLEACRKGEDPAQQETGEDETSAEIVSGKKRRPASSNASKQRDLLFGEIWRAKNLPNDALSLPRHPLIRSIAFVPSSDETESGTLMASVVVGTKDGVIRVYEPGKKNARHVHEWQIATKNQGAIRVLTPSLKDNLLFVGDSARNLYAVDFKAGRVLFQYKGMSMHLTQISQARFPVCWFSPCRRKRSGKPSFSAPPLIASFASLILALPTPMASAAVAIHSARTLRVSRTLLRWLPRRPPSRFIASLQRRRRTKKTCGPTWRSSASRLTMMRVTRTRTKRSAPSAAVRRP